MACWSGVYHYHPIDRPGSVGQMRVASSLAFSCPATALLGLSWQASIRLCFPPFTFLTFLSSCFRQFWCCVDIIWVFFLCIVSSWSSMVGCADSLFSLQAGAQRPGGYGGGIYPPNIFGSVGNFLFHSVKITAVGKSRKS